MAEWPLIVNMQILHELHFISGWTPHLNVAKYDKLPNRQSTLFNKEKNHILENWTHIPMISKLEKDFRNHDNLSQDVYNQTRLRTNVTELVSGVSSRTASGDHVAILQLRKD